MIRLVFFLCDNMLVTSAALPMEQFRAAESIDRVSTRGRTTPIELVLASLDGKPVRTQTGLILTPDVSIFDIDHAEITYLPALWRDPEAVLYQHRPLIPWLQKRHTHGETIAGVGTGCCFMAEAGLLDHRPATTHWFYFNKFAERYPLVNLKRQHFITHSDGLFCTGSVNALADLTVFFIQKIFSPVTANLVERHFFHEVRHAFSMSLHSDQTNPHPDEEIAGAQSWMRTNYHLNETMETIARQAGMSLRTFNRRFKNATSQTPLQYLQQIRMKAAGELLQNTNISIAEVAYRSGYQDLAHFTSLFKKHFGTTPSQYRTTVRAKLFTVDGIN